MAEPHVEVARTSALADALAAVARARSYRVTVVDVGADLKVDGVVHDLPDRVGIGRTQTSLVLGLIAESLSPRPSRVVATVLAPAAGRCGPCVTGPIDAVRDDGVGTGWTLGATPIPWSAYTVRVQQSRCWLVHATLGVPDGSPSPRSGLPVLPPVVAVDTARISEYQRDRGAGVHWTDTLLLEQPRSHDGWVVARAVFSDGAVAAHLLDRAVGSQSDRGMR